MLCIILTYAHTLVIFFSSAPPDNSEIRQQLYSWKDRMDMVRKLLTLLNSYTPPDVRNHAIGEYCESGKKHAVGKDLHLAGFGRYVFLLFCGIFNS